MTDTPQLSGKDLARQALAAYKATARTAPTAGPAKPKRKRTLRTGDGRDPISFAAAIAGLGADVPLEAGVSGGNVIDQWPTLCPQYADTVQPVAYDTERGRLDLRPANYAVASGLRLLGGQLAKQINDKLGKPVVRSIRVLPVGNIDTPRAAAVPSDQPQTEAPVKTRDMASRGYQATLEAALAHRPERQPTNPYVLEAMAAHEKALRAKRQPESEHREAVWEQLDAEEKAGPAPGSVEESLARARAYARQERAGHTPRRALDIA
ncbi:DciA family protein (plasmid) [Streptomyces chartreusis]|uniref:DciA family protein n=1 Tax=Streptomyces chartreusis TaxID=1969 RepID=UPI0037DD0F05|nr:DciA family protein [Streptomyces chartreusis]